MTFLIDIIVSSLFFISIYLMINHVLNGKDSLLTMLVDDLKRKQKQKIDSTPNRTIADMRDVEVGYIRYIDIDNLTLDTPVSPYKRGLFQHQMTNAGHQYGLVWRDGKQESIEIKQ